MNRRRPERLLAWVALPVGILLAVLIPPGQGPDEPAHFLRAFDLAEGRIAPRRVADRVGDELPKSVPAMLAPFERLEFSPRAGTSVEEVRHAWSVALAPSERELVLFPSSTAFVPLVYAPAASGALLGRAAELPPLVILWLARLGGLIGGLALAVLAVRCAPTSRWLLVALALDPMATFLRSAVSGDVVTFGIVLIWLALVLESRCEDRPLRRTALLVAAAAIGLAKLVYAPLALLVWLVPEGRFRDRRSAALFRGGALGAAVAGAAAAAIWARAHSAVFRVEVATDPAAQLALVVEHPLRFLGLAATDAIVHGPRYALELVGNLGWLDTPLPTSVRVLYATGLVALSVVDGPRELTARDRLVVLLATLATVLALALSQYVMWTRLGGDEIDGLQGRYFLPVAAAASLLIAPVGRFGAVPEAVRFRLAASLATIAAVSTVAVVGARYFLHG